MSQSFSLSTSESFSRGTSSSHPTTTTTGSTGMMMQYAVPSFAMGCTIAVVSQFVLQYIFYDYNLNSVLHFLYNTNHDNENDPTMTFSTTKIICFSILWSCITCAIVFLGMISFMYLYESISGLSSATTTKKPIKVTTDPQEEDDDDDNAEEETEPKMLAMELSYVFGAITAIILLWSVYDFGIVEYSTMSGATTTVGNSIYFNHHHQPSFYFFVKHLPPMVMVMISSAITVLALMILSIVIRFVWNMYANCNQRDAADEELKAATDMEAALTSDAPSTFCMMSSSPSPSEWIVYCIASTLGLFVGISTQMILSFILWNNVNQIPYVIQSNWTIALFSFAWSTITVIVTALACYALRAFVFYCIVPNMHRTLSIHYQNVLVIRMEAMYIGWTLTGICIGWIVLDVLHHMASQIYISIALFILSLSSFAGILYYFPESENLEDDEFETEDSVSTFTEPLLSSDDSN